MKWILGILFRSIFIISPYFQIDVIYIGVNVWRWRQLRLRRYNWQKIKIVRFFFFVYCSVNDSNWKKDVQIKTWAILSYSMCSDSYYLLFRNKIAFNLVNILLFYTIVYVKGWKDSRIGPNYKDRLNNQSKTIRAIWF